MAQYLGVKGTNGKISREPTDSDGYPVKLTAGSATIGIVDTELPAAGALADSMSNPTTPLVGSALEVFNGTSWDRLRNNTQGTLLASAARTATTIAPLQTNYNARGVQIYLNVTAASGTGGLIVSIEGQDSVSGQYFQLNVSPTPVTATGKTAYELYPGSTGTGATISQRTSGVLPRSWRAIVNHSDGTSYTYSLGYSYIV